MKNVTSSVNVRLLTLGLGLAASLGAMSPAYGYRDADVYSFVNYGVAKYYHLEGANLSNLDLPRRKVTYSYLSDANLSNSNFMFADMRYNDFKRANLSGGNFTAVDFFPPTSRVPTSRVLTSLEPISIILD